jgi:hypothetical protein
MSIQDIFKDYIDTVTAKAEEVKTKIESSNTAPAAPTPAPVVEAAANTVVTSNTEVTANTVAIIADAIGTIVGAAVAAPTTAEEVKPLQHVDEVFESINKDFVDFHHKLKKHLHDSMKLRVEDFIDPTKRN